MTVDVAKNSPLGRETAYPDRYDPSVLFPIPRAAQRVMLGAGTDPLPFRGEDIWTAYELSWLDRRGKPEVAIATFRVPADSPAMVESKSLKLYLNGFANERFDDVDAVGMRIASDLSACCDAPVAVALWPSEAMDTLDTGWLSGESIDALPIEIAPCEGPEASLLRPVSDRIEGGVEETLVSRLFRSNCPVTGQPDWADVQIRYCGNAIDRASLLRYIVSFRSHCGFHEQCVERMFADIKARCAPSALTVYARFTRRGGLDINPWRSDDPAFASPQNVRTARQ